MFMLFISFSSFIAVARTFSSITPVLGDLLSCPDLIGNALKIFQLCARLAVGFGIYIVLPS